MSDSPFPPGQPSDGAGGEHWKDMLRAVFGERAANEIIESFGDQGIDPAQMMPAMGGADMSVVLNQIRSMLGRTSDGPVDWSLAERVARETLTSEAPDRLQNGDVTAVKDNLQLASLWLDNVTDIESSFGPLQAWSRLDWVAHTQGTFRRLAEPVAENVARAFGEAMASQMENLPEEMKGMLGGFGGADGDDAGGFGALGGMLGGLNPASLMHRMVAASFGMQFGQALAELARQVFGTSDTGLPLVEGPTAALVPANVADFAEGLDVPVDEVRLYVAVREQAHARLFAHAPWLRAQLIDTVAAWARDISVNMEAIEEQAQSIDPTSPEGFAQMQELDLTGVFQPEPTPAQQATLERLELLLALIEGWVSEVTAAAVVDHLPHATALREMVTRRRATGGATEKTFGALVGLEVRPRKVREAAAFWALALERTSVPGRDHLWSHPDLLPDAEALDNPASFFEHETSDIDTEIDDLLADIFKDEPESGPAGEQENTD